MSAGGSTWAGAGVLTQGTNNAFAVSSTTEPGGGGSHMPYNLAYWKFTPDFSGPVRLTTLLSSVTPGDVYDADTIIRLYSGGTDIGSATFLAYNDDGGGDGPTPNLSVLDWDVTSGTTYHLMVGTYASDPQRVTLYRVNYIRMVEHASPWDSSLRDDDQNFLIISGSNGDLQQTNAAGYRTTKDFYGDAFSGASPGREGQYGISEPAADNGRNPAGYPHGTGGGDEEADDCAFSHALNGDRTGLGGPYWNSDPDNGEAGGTPVCQTLFTGPADSFSNGAGGYRYYARHVGGFVPDNIRATDGMTSRAVFARQVLEGLKDLLGPIYYRIGTLNFPEPEGVVPQDLIDAFTYKIEWDGDLELMAVYFTGDRPSRGAGVSIPLRLFANDAVLPTYDGTSWSAWARGRPGVGDGSGNPHHDVEYDDEADPDWNDLGINAWGSVDTPDAMIGMALRDVDMPTLAAGDYGISNDSDVAVMFVFRSPRFRFTWVTEPPPAELVIEDDHEVRRRFTPA